MADRKKKEKQTNTVKGKASPTPAAGKGKARPAAGKGATDQTPQAEPIREQAQPIQPDTTTAAEPAEFYTDEQLKAAADFVQGVGALQTAQETYRTEVQEMLKKINYDTVQQTIEAYKKNIRGILSAATQGFEAAQNLYSTFQQAADWQGLRDFVANINDLLKSSTDLRDFLTEAAAFYEEVEKELQKPEYEGLTADQLEELAGDPAADPKYKELWQQAQDNARAAMAERAAQEETDTTTLPKIRYQDSTEVKTVTDKFAQLFFSLAAPQSKGMINGQRQFTQVRYEKHGAKKEITLLYDYSFNEDIIKRFGLSKSFDDQAYFVASIIDNLLDEGNSAVSLTKIWHELGNDGSPSTEALTNLVNILRLGMSTIITADISQVSDAWEITTTGTSRELISPVIPVQIAHEKFTANGKTANAVINITGHTPFYLIGYPINHYTTWKKDVLRLYTGRRTKRYYSVLRFLITQIGWMRNAKSNRSNKILYASLYEYTGDKGTRQQQLSRDMMYRLFDEVFIPTEYITAYKEDSTGKPGVILTFTRPPKIGTSQQKRKTQ